MRSIKFRTWDREYKKMKYSCNPVCHGELNVLDFSWLEKDYVVMQYTGLKDKAKHEICEGDILCMNPVDDEWYDVVVFQNGKFELKSCMNPDGDFHLADWCYDSSNPGLIVGNIHENKDLLEETKCGGEKA